MEIFWVLRIGPLFCNEIITEHRDIIYCAKGCNEIIFSYDSPRGIFFLVNKYGFARILFVFFYNFFLMVSDLLFVAAQDSRNEGWLWATLICTVHFLDRLFSFLFILHQKVKSNDYQIKDHYNIFTFIPFGNLWRSFYFHDINRI